MAEVAPFGAWRSPVSARDVAGLAGVPEAETWLFCAHGMMLNIVAMLDLDRMPEEH